MSENDSGQLRRLTDAERRLEQIQEETNPKGQAITLRVVTHKTLVDEVTGERREIPLVGEYDEGTPYTDIGNGDLYRVLYPKNEKEPEPGVVLPWPWPGEGNPRAS